MNMKTATALLLACLTSTTFGEETEYRFRVTSFFIPEREEAIRKAVKDYHKDITVVDLDFDTAIITLRFDPKIVMERVAGGSLEQQRHWLSHGLTGQTTGIIRINPLSTIPKEQIKEVTIPIAGLDCIGCSYAAYESVRRLPGVEYAVADFREGRVLARFDTKQTSEDALITGILKRGITLNYKIESKGLVPPEEMSIVRFSSEESGSQGFARHAIDGDPQTKWESQWHRGILAQPPHELVIDLQRTRKITGFRYLARQLGSVGVFAKTEFFVSDSPDSFGDEPAAITTFKDIKSVQAVDLGGSVSGRYVQVRMVSEINGKPNGTAAEIGIIAARGR